MSKLNTSAFSMYTKKSKKSKSKKSKKRSNESGQLEEPTMKKIKANNINVNGLNGSVSENGNDITKIRKSKSNKKLKKTKNKELTVVVAHTEIESNCNSDDEVPQLVPILSSGFLKGDSIDSQTTETPTDLLKWLINPIEPATFFEQYWEKGPLHITRNYPKYYKPVLTSAEIDTMLREHPLHFGRNVDVVKYEGNKRITENPVGRAEASIVWDSYSNGYSIRILNPHTYNPKVHKVLSTLQEYFGAMVGANVYLTPAGSQGFAPHFDDIEAFVIQLEGRKHWKLYKPKNEESNLTRFSSIDFKCEDLGPLIAKVTLNAGDILYFPRGCVHEAKTDDEKHSLHMTISTYQNTSYIDLLEKVLPEALRRAAASDIEYRRGLPIGYLKQLGVSNSDNNSSDRTTILRKVQELIVKLAVDAPIDFAADALGRKFMHEALPPVLSIDEKHCSSKYDGERIKNGVLINKGEISPDTEIRLLRYYAIRLGIETNGEARVYYCTQNSKVYHGEEEQFITIDPEMCHIIEILIQQYPNYVSVEFLPHADLVKKMDLITELWDYGLLVTKQPLDITDSDVD